MVPGSRCVAVSLTATGLLPLIACLEATVMPYDLVSPSSKRKCATLPFGFTVPFRTAEDEVTELALPVVTVGEDAASAVAAEASPAAAMATSSLSMRFMTPCLLN